jgi:hypothetical protein
MARPGFRLVGVEPKNANPSGQSWHIVFELRGLSDERQKGAPLGPRPPITVAIVVKFKETGKDLDDALREARVILGQRLENLAALLRKGHTRSEPA